MAQFLMLCALMMSFAFVCNAAPAQKARPSSQRSGTGESRVPDKGTSWWQPDTTPKSEEEADPEGDAGSDAREDANSDGDDDDTTTTDDDNDDDYGS